MPRAIRVEYPGSSYHVMSRGNRRVRVDRLLGEHGLRADTAAGRPELERRVEALRGPDANGDRWAPLRRGWGLGSSAFRKQMVGPMEGHLGEDHAGELRRETAAAKAERIIAEELQRRGWPEGELERRAKGDGDKLEMAARVRRETTLPMKWIAARLWLGTWKSTAPRLRGWQQNQRSKEDGDKMAIL